MILNKKLHGIELVPNVVNQIPLKLRIHGVVPHLRVYLKSSFKAHRRVVVDGRSNGGLNSLIVILKG